jgi:hypothetical protein
MQYHLEVVFRGVFAAFNYNEPLAVRRESIVGASGFVPDLTLIEDMSFSNTEGWRAEHVDSPQHIGTFINEAAAVARPNGVDSPVGRYLHFFARSGEALNIDFVTSGFSRHVSEPLSVR